jgi:diaminohydroxyphosphoribosylaminopyrimidine deaminase/5-amino-6-(5-phosphoribosylamino)uracil reductase
VRVLLLRCAGEHVDVRAMMRALGARGITSVLVEGGGDFLAALFEAGLVDRVMFWYAPLVIGGREATMAVAGRGAGRLAEAVRLRAVRWRRLSGGQMLCEGEVAG